MAVKHGYRSELYDDKVDALAIAHGVAKIAGYCFAVQGRFGWYVCKEKPNFRCTEVIECREDGDITHSGGTGRRKW